MTVRWFAVLVPMGVLLVSIGTHADENWPQWRGPDQNGTSSATNLPEAWSETENVVWKTPLPSWSGGTPIIWGDRIFLTSPSKPATDAGSSPEGGPTLLLLALSKKDGSAVWETELDTGNKMRNKQNDSSPSPVTDGEHVWAVTGTGTVARRQSRTGNTFGPSQAQERSLP